ncbi:type II secretion system minor pseudopilin GspI [Parvularcula lutaonensis]|uniref:Type II secretion system protein I n=1 Tax=Parvularcula lutaonensis TaxID=491923 RepID=A0ABV7MFR6_9PROT|nr:type II secretion system minor pseudopilin GspI [Parvularcula lutaonensis]GGY52720.1 hypothetical protein GCM10007148_22430 [Parvularcula lutaonensis]
MRDQKGLTLIEVLVALAVLSSIVGSILVLIGQHTRHAAAIEERALARIVAENAMVAYVAAKRSGQPADLSGEEEIAGRAFTYVIDRSPAPLEGFETVETNVRIGRDGQVLATLSTLRAVEGLE